MMHEPSATLWVSLPGVVRSVKEKLSSQFVEKCKGVVQRLTLQEHKMVWNRTTHLWYVPTAHAHDHPAEVPSEGLK